MTEADLLKRITAHYDSPEYAVLTHVRNATGHNKTVRTADAVALSLYPSRGITLHGFEVKVSRSDWQRELKEPDKQEEIGAYCHHWWMVTPDESVIRAGELPAGWGWMIVDPKTEKLKVLTRAPYRRHPKPLDLLFVASLLRNACDDRRNNWVRQSDIADKIEAAHQSGMKTAGWVGKSQLDETRKELDTIKAQVRAFEQASGVSLETGKYRSVIETEYIGAAVAEVLSGNESAKKARLMLSRSARQLAEVHRDLGVALDKVREITIATQQQPASTDSTASGIVPGQEVATR